MKTLIVSIIVALTAVAAAIAFQKGGGHMTGQTQHQKVDIPPVDKQAPSRFETATFALG